MSVSKLVNGQPAETINLADRGLQFGDGVFRTIKVLNGEPIWWARHYAKLAHDCATIGIVAPTEASLLADIEQLHPNNNTLKIIVTRGETARGYIAPADLPPNRIVQIAPLPAYSPDLATQGVTLRTCATRASWQPALAGIKHLNRLENILARREWSDPSIFDGLMFDRDDHLIEGVMSNVLVLLDGVLCTPDLSESGVAGVCRDMTLLAAAQLGIPTAVCKIKREQLSTAKALWVCNSLAGLLPVVALDDWCWPVSPLQHDLRTTLFALKD
ncbi:aminodeoxychorismate lyase [Chitinibacter sp. GC72]|uniref:aminodeoxychorismate lyase n=1 Tax=Chitinibacter sp. GC72 TaxID=1526917 RepID=UPI0012FB7400|nr:aminodeoxychorismate lyase [Chitinibacter sp. GC72]